MMKPHSFFYNKRIQDNITYKITRLLRAMYSFPLSRAVKHDRDFTKDFYCIEVKGHVHVFKTGAYCNYDANFAINVYQYQDDFSFDQSGLNVLMPLTSEKGSCNKGADKM